MTKLNVFDANKQVKQDVENLLGKFKTLNKEIDKQLVQLDSMWNKMEQPKEENIAIQAVSIEKDNEVQAEQVKTVESLKEVSNVSPDISPIKENIPVTSVVQNIEVNVSQKQTEKIEPAISASAKDEAPMKEKTETVPKAPVEKAGTPVIETKKPEDRPSRVDDRRPTGDSVRPPQRPQFDRRPNNFVPRPNSENVKTQTNTSPARPQTFPPRTGFQNQQRPATGEQSTAQRGAGAKPFTPFTRGRTDRKVDIVDKFFADPELKERDKKEKEEAAKASAQRNVSTASKVKVRQDKKENWVDNDQGDQVLTKLKTQKARPFHRQIIQEVVKPTAERKKSITMGEFITVKDLSEKIGVSASELIKSLIKLGIMVTINQEIDYDTAMLVSSEFNIELEKKVVKTFEQVMADDDTTDATENLFERPPIVTVMGHVDHGKTSLLDAIRNARVTEQEAGGITQHIGAYTVDMNNRKITFLDTPGHEAFTSMRARGAQVTDIAILVVAADDGIMPQTVEAINHAKAANVPIIVAVNKIDVPGADPDKVTQQLTEYGLVSEKWGGETIVVPVSALKKLGIDTLLEMILLVSEVLELKANPGRLAKGTVIEAQLDKGRGPVATVLVQNGTLNIGDAIVAGTSYGRVRAMMDHKGNRIKKAGPSTPVEVIGLSEVPDAGDLMMAVKDDKLAKQVAEERVDKSRSNQVKTLYKASLDTLLSQFKEGEMKELNIIVKADVQGSVEAVKNAIERIPSETIRIRTIHGGVGAIAESDVMLATASNAILIGFNVRPSTLASDLAAKEKIDIRVYRVIYNLIEDIQAAIKGMLAPEIKENIIGHAVIRAVFKVTGMGNIAGCYVTDGKIARNAGVRLLRDNVVIHEGKINTLKRFKDDAKEVATGYECGISISNFNDIKENDIIEAFIKEEVKSS